MSRLRARDRPARAAARQDAGVTLIELLVALAIGSLLVVAGIQVFAHGRTAYRAAESIAALQESARYALTALAFDIEHAGFWGLTNDASLIAGRRSLPAGPVIAVGNDCGEDWTIDLDLTISGTNNRYGWVCRPYQNRAAAESDTLVVRRADVAPAVSEESGRIYVRTTRFGNGLVYVAPAPVAPPDAAFVTIHELSVRGYYVSETSSLSTPGNAVPSLRVKTLTGGSVGPRIVDEEIYPGIEDMQIELGIDRDAPGTAGFGEIDAYVGTESPEIPGARVLAVRIWLLVRGLQRENGFTASPPQTYADRQIPARDDRYRRALVSTTVLARNAPPRI